MNGGSTGRIDPRYFEDGQRLPLGSRTWRPFDWDWRCSPLGCGDGMGWWEITGTAAIRAVTTVATVASLRTPRSVRGPAGRTILPVDRRCPVDRIIPSVDWLRWRSNFQQIDVSRRRAAIPILVSLFGNPCDGFGEAGNVFATVGQVDDQFWEVWATNSFAESEPAARLVFGQSHGAGFPVGSAIRIRWRYLCRIRLPLFG